MRAWVFLEAFEKTYKVHLVKLSHPMFLKNRKKIKTFTGPSDANKGDERRWNGDGWRWRMRHGRRGARGAAGRRRACGVYALRLWMAAAWRHPGTASRKIKRKLNTGGRSQRPAPVHRHAGGQSSRPLACGHLVRTQEDTGEEKTSIEYYMR